MAAEGMITTEDSFYGEACSLLVMGRTTRNSNVMRAVVRIVDRGVACRACGRDIVGARTSSIASGHCDDCYDEAGEEHSVE